MSQMASLVINVCCITRVFAERWINMMMPIIIMKQSLPKQWLKLWATNVCSQHVLNGWRSSWNFLWTFWISFIQYRLDYMQILWQATQSTALATWYLQVMMQLLWSTPITFFPGLKPSFSTNPSHHSLPFFFRTDSMDSPDYLSILLSISFFYFPCFPCFSFWFHVVD